MLREEDLSFDLTELIKMSQNMCDADWSSYCIISPEDLDKIFNGMTWNEITNNFELCEGETNG